MKLTNYENDIERELDETRAFLTACARLEAAEIKVIRDHRIYKEYLRLSEEADRRSGE